MAFAYHLLEHSFVRNNKDLGARSANFCIISIAIYRLMLPDAALSAPGQERLVMSAMTDMFGHY